MKKVFAIIAMSGLLLFGMNQAVYAQEATEEATEAVEATDDENAEAAEVDSTEDVAAEETAAEEEAAPAEEELREVGAYHGLKTKFIEGSAGFMALVAIALVIGLAFCIERIIYLALSDVNPRRMTEDIEAALLKGDVEGAKAIARDERGPIASIYYQGIMRLNEGADSVEKAVVSYGAVQASNLEKGCSWITLFIGMAPSLGFLGTVIGMVQAFDDIQAAGDISPTVVAGGMKVALLTTIFGIVVALILQVFYNYILAKIEGITAQMENSTIDLLDIVYKFNAKK